MQVFGALAVVVLPAAGARHADHQVFVEVAPQAHGGGADPSRRPVGAVLLDLGLRAQAAVGLSVGQQQHAGERSGSAGFQDLRARFPAVEQGRAAAALHTGQRQADRGRVAARTQCNRHLHLVVVEHDGQAVGRLQAAGNVLGAAQGLVQRLAGHAAGAVDHDRQPKRLSCGGRRRGSIGRLQTKQHFQGAAVGRGGLPDRIEDQGGSWRVVVQRVDVHLVWAPVGV
jgi:hypothetical protein